MSKITFRADDDLVEQLEGLEASKSEAMREALRSYLEGDGSARSGDERSATGREGEGAIDELVRERVDERLATRLRELGHDRADARARGSSSTDPQDITISISLEGATAASEETVQIERDHARETTDGTRQPGRTQAQPDTQSEADVTCNQCGDRLDGDHVYCPNCGEKASRRLFCDCGDEVRSDWSFCPGCGRRTPAADVLESDSSQY
ncbi:double zinc ribbon domain-containing protein [Natrinema sp. LN54]|uniref:double zinc ribbon domain-containing protein n=1 Tax=Natrinema sp. LN54 TaxID=3458705 RepID=UPI0040366B6E